jgi:hypothetical protein
LTEAGYVGDDVESLLCRLPQEANGDIGAAQRGIVSIDEIDKLRAGGMGGKDMRVGVQHAMLKMRGGTVATVPPQGGWRHPMQPGIPFDTTDILFICGGGALCGDRGDRAGREGGQTQQDPAEGTAECARDAAIASSQPTSTRLRPQRIQGLSPSLRRAEPPVPLIA